MRHARIHHIHVNAEDLFGSKSLCTAPAPTSSTGGVLEGGVRVDKTPKPSPCTIPKGNMSLALSLDFEPFRGLPLQISC
jgi:hypothetical protein